MLYVVGTPIGNLSDISERAREVLKIVDAVACEDTRRTGLLLASLDIHQRLISYHDHNRASKGGYLLSLMQQGQNIALVTDAGMPCISDPGEELVRLCIDHEIPVSVVPGPVAAVTALVLSGLDTARFLFEGFLPSEGKDRKLRIQELADHRVTCILYEAPHRLLKTLRDLVSAGLGDRNAAFCREMTKKFEETVRLSVHAAVEYFEKNPPRGEFVIVIEGCTKEEAQPFLELSDENIEKRIRECVENGMSTKEVSGILAKEWGISKKQVYSMIVKMIN